MIWVYRLCLGVDVGLLVFMVTGAESSMSNVGVLETLPQSILNKGVHT